MFGVTSGRAGQQVQISTCHLATEVINLTLQPLGNRFPEVLSSEGHTQIFQFIHRKLQAQFF